MKSSVVVGCDAVDAGADWVRLRVPGGSLRTLAWSAIQTAALLTNDGSMTFEGDLEQISALRATHDPLWIECDGAVEIALLEKDNPKRDSIVATFKERLGSRWMDQLSAMDAAMRFMNAPALRRSSGIPRLAILAIAGTILIFLVAFVVSRLVR